MDVKTNFNGIPRIKSVFDAGIKELLVKAINEGQVKQTEDGDNEVFLVTLNGKEVATVSQNYKDMQRATIIFNGKKYSRKDRHYGDGRINDSLSRASSSESTNTIEEKDFADIYSLVASRCM